MSKKNNIIEINGNRYDVSTGKAIDGVDKTVQTTKKSTTKSPPSRHAVAPNARSHAPQPAKTLRRDILSKPLPANLSSGKKLRKSSPIKVPKVSLPTKLSIANIDGRRIQHSKAIPKSTLVSRFSSSPLSPSPLAFNPPSPSPLQTVGHVASPKLQATPKADFLQEAINKATSHQQPLYKPAKSKRQKVVKRIVGVSGLAFGLLILIGIVGFQNLANLKINSASSKAGFAASLPAYQPSGFSLGDISSNPGQVAVNFISNSDNSRNYTITEKPSNWDSSNLRDILVTNSDPQFQAVTSNGRTIYLYGLNNATWVSNGVWYTVTGNGSLSYQQLLDIANSL